MLQNLLSPKSLKGSANFGVLILRIGLGLLMLTHGYPKFEKLLAGDTGFADPIFLGESLSLILTVFAEAFCSLLLIIGLFTRPALFFLIITMTVAAFIIHGKDGLDVKEHALMFLIGYLCLWFTGPGKYSADQKLF